ncbi:MAG: hypothetical protein JXR70_02005 [Spirochaetales bacterium]|nr:hypothetical protein [Spirochaetales bacterium]
MIIADYKAVYEELRRHYRVESMKLLRSQEKRKFLQYFFKDRPKIMAWNQSFDLIHFSFFGIKIALSDHFKEKITELYYKIILPVKVYIPEILNYSWRWKSISMEDYNLVVYLADFIQKYENLVTNHKFNDKDFLMLQQSFVRFLYHESYASKMISAFTRAVKELFLNLQKDNSKAMAQIEELQEFFSYRYVGFSLFQAILAYNMVYYRRFLEFKDLVAPYTGHILQKDIYLCSYEVFNTMMNYLKNKYTELENWQKKLSEHLWIRSISKMDSPEDMKILEEFYASLGHDFQEDKGDAFLVMLLIAEGLANSIEEIHFNSWHLLSTEEEEKTMKISTTKDIDPIIKEIFEDLELAKARYSTVMPIKISLGTYNSWENPELFLNEKHQHFFYQKFQKIFSSFHTIAMCYRDILANKDKQAFTFLRFMVLSPQRYHGKAVYQVYEYFLKLIMKLCRYFKEENLSRGIRSAAKIEKIIQEIETDIDSLRDSNHIIDKGLEENQDVSENETDPEESVKA